LIASLEARDRRISHRPQATTFSFNGSSDMRVMGSSDLRQVPSQYIVDGMDRLPPCGPDSTEEHLEIDVPLTGSYRVTFRPRKQARRGWPTCWIWIPTRAEAMEGGDTLLRTFRGS